MVKSAGSQTQGSDHMVCSALTRISTSCIAICIFVCVSIFKLRATYNNNNNGRHLHVLAHSYSIYYESFVVVWECVNIASI